MSNWYYLKHRTPYPFGCTILSDPKLFCKLMDKHFTLTRKIRSKYLDGYWVSTIFLGLDHSYDEGGEPLLFETMVFKGDSMSHIECFRCHTHRQALKQHKEGIAYVKYHKEVTAIKTEVARIKNKLNGVVNEN